MFCRSLIVGFLFKTLFAEHCWTTRIRSCVWASPHILRALLAVGISPTPAAVVSIMDRGIEYCLSSVLARVCTLTGSCLWGAAKKLGRDVDIWNIWIPNSFAGIFGFKNECNWSQLLFEKNTWNHSIWKPSVHHPHLSLGLQSFQQYHDDGDGWHFPQTHQASGSAAVINSQVMDGSCGSKMPRNKALLYPLLHSRTPSWSTNMSN